MTTTDLRNVLADIQKVSRSQPGCERFAEHLSDTITFRYATERRQALAVRLDNEIASATSHAMGLNEISVDNANLDLRLEDLATFNGN